MCETTKCTRCGHGSDYHGEEEGFTGCGMIGCQCVGMMRTWPDGQVRPEYPYRCGAFVTSSGEQCTKLSDHDGEHGFASDSTSVAGHPGEEANG